MVSTLVSSTGLVETVPSHTLSMSVPRMSSTPT